MSVYKRFVSYMFRYENGIKKDNVGYARIENYGEECRIQIHIKDMVKREQKASVYLFYRKEGRMQGIFMKEMLISEGVGECKITTNSKNIGDSGCDFEKVGGVIVYITANRFWGTEWDDNPIYRFEPEYLNEKLDTQKEELQEEEQILIVESVPEENKFELKAAVLEEDEELYEVERCYYEKQEDCFSPYTKIYPFYEQDKECIGVTLCELCTVSPSLEKWKENIFVQYGYSRFRHIIILRKKEEPDVFFIGVPGMYKKDEEQIALTYGFDKFIPVRKERAEHGDFGYWCTEAGL